MADRRKGRPSRLRVKLSADGRPVARHRMATHQVINGSGSFGRPGSQAPIDGGSVRSSLLTTAEKSPITSALSARLGHHGTGFLFTACSTAHHPA